MVSAQHRLWINRGSPWHGVPPALAYVRDTLRGAGYTVYDFPDDSHLDAEPPEDHTPFAETGWPVPSEYGWGHAIDIMPPPSGRNLPSLQTLGQRLFAARQA